MPGPRPSRRLAKESSGSGYAVDEQSGACYVPSQPRRPRSRMAGSTEGGGLEFGGSQAFTGGLGATADRPVSGRGDTGFSGVARSQGSTLDGFAREHVLLARPPAVPARASASPRPAASRAVPAPTDEDDEDGPRRFFGPKDVGSGLGDYPAPQVGLPLGLEDAQDLMAVVGVPELGSPWRQGLFFAGLQPYGLHQVEGGPCGVLAVLQALVIKNLCAQGLSSAALLAATEAQRQEALVAAVAEVLFTNIGDGKKAILIAPAAGLEGRPVGAQQLRDSKPTTFSSLEQMKLALGKRPWKDGLFQPSGVGLASLLFSVVLTRGTMAIRKNDADDEKAAVMIGGHGYCTQELVNLMIFGRAYSNVFDGSKRIGSGKDFCVLQGAPRRASVGFMSLFEAYKCLEVGQRMKAPTSPVWIVCAESHYTVLFSADASVDPKDDKSVIDLHYFDQLARQSECIRLTVRPHNLPSHLDTGFEEGESMIDKCIRTKWKDASVDWNGTEIIL